MMERSTCGSGGCMLCPFSTNDQAEEIWNYACLPSPYEIVKMKEKSGHNWSCHSDATVLCGGFAKHVKEHRPDLDIKQGNLISYDIWYHEGEEIALEKAGEGR